MSRVLSIRVVCPLGVLALLVPLACTDKDDSMLTSGDASTTTTTSGPVLTSDDTTTGGISTTSTGPGADTSTSAVPDVAPDDGLCHVFDPSCPVGQKCMPWSTKGGTDWNAWGCFPVVEDPVGIGEPCHLLDEPFTGLDECEEGSMCWDFNPRTYEGTCFPFCIGSERDPVCADPDRFCDISGDGTPYLCSLFCLPLAQDCPPGQECLPDGNWWVCGGLGDGGAYGDPCEFVNGCDPGLVCLDPATVPPGQPCEGENGCCTELCDLTDPLGDAQCIGAAEGQICQPWYESEAPMVFENVGACALP